MTETYQPQHSVSHSQAVIVLSTILRLGLSLVLTIILGRILSPPDFGFYGFVIVVFVVARELMDVGTGSLAVREIALVPEREQAMLETLMSLRVLVGGGLALACAVLAMRQDPPSQRWLLLSVAMVLPLLSAGVLGLAYQLRQHLLPPALIVLTLQVFMLVGCLACYRIGASAWSYAALVVAREVLGLIWLNLHAAKTLGLRLRPRFDWPEMGAFLRKSITIGAAAVIYNLYFYIGPLLIWFIRPAAEMGAYSAAFRPISQLLAFPWLLMLPLLPALTHFAANDRPALQQEASRLAPLAAGIGAIIAVAGLELSQDALLALYGYKYISGPLSAIVTLQLLSLSFVFSMTTAVAATILLAAGREMELVLLCLTGLLVNLAWNFLFLPVYGFPAAAAATLATESCVSACGLILVMRAALLKPRWKELGLLLLPAIALAVVLQFLPDTPGWRRLAPALLLAAAALLALMRMSRVQRGRRQPISGAMDVYRL